MNVASLFISYVVFQKTYKEDWEYEKSCVYYPVHITPGYEAQVEVAKIQSDVRLLLPMITIFYESLE